MTPTTMTVAESARAYLDSFGETDPPVLNLSPVEKVTAKWDGAWSYVVSTDDLTGDDLDRIAAFRREVEAITP